MAKKIKIPKKVRKQYKRIKKQIGAEQLFKYDAAYIISKCCNSTDNLFKAYQSEPEIMGLIMHYLYYKLLSNGSNEVDQITDNMYARILSAKHMIKSTEDKTSERLELNSVDKYENGKINGGADLPYKMMMDDTVPGYYFKSDQKAIKAIERSEKGFIERYKRGEYNSLAADELYKALTGDENGISLKKHFELREERERKFREAEERRNNMITSDNNEEEDE